MIGSSKFLSTKRANFGLQREIVSIIFNANDI